MSADGRQPDSGFRRIHVVGTTGSGKTTLAQRLAQLLRFPHVELDALHWGPNWTLPTVEDFRESVAEALSGDRWMVDGNYGKVRDIVWARADTVVWLDYALPVIMGRLLWRTIRRGVRREELWSGNRERLWIQFFSRDSLLLWALQTYRRRQREYPMLLARPEYAHLAVVRLRSPRATKDWLSGFHHV
jgi:adenylate kinase family enzyme